jgi:hypothetical protein
MAATNPITTPGGSAVAPSSQVTVTAQDPSGSNYAPPTADVSMGDPALQSVGTGAATASPDYSSIDYSTDSSGSGLSSVLSGLTGGTGLSGLAGLGVDAAIAGYGLSEASSAQAQTQAEANQILGPANSLINAGNGQLAQFEAQTLTPAQQSYVDFSTQEGQNIIASGQGMQQIATQYLGDFASGNLNPADALQLSQNTAAQKQQVAQMMSTNGTPDSSVLAAYNQQIDNQAIVSKQNTLNGYFATGNTAYNTFLTSSAQGSALIGAGANFAQTAFQEMMTNALGLEGAGMTGLTSAIGLEINGDTAIQGQVSQLMTNLASAYAYQVSGGGGSATGNSSLNSLINMGKTTNSLYNNGTNLYNSYTAGQIGSTAEAGEAGDIDNVLGSTTAGDLNAAGDVSDSDISSLLGGFNSAGGEAATSGVGAGGATAGSAAADDLGGASLSGAQSFTNAGVDAYTAEAGADAAADSGAAAGAGADASTIGLGAAAGAAGALAGIGIPLIVGMETPAVQLKASYWSGVSSALTGAGANTSPGSGGAAAKEYDISDTVQEALQTPQAEVPQAIQQQVWATGLVPYGQWGTPTPNTAVGAGSGGVGDLAGARRDDWE